MIAQELFDQLLDQRVICFPKLNNDDMKALYKWHVNELHTTDKCQAFRAFIARRMKDNKMTLTNGQARAMDLADKAKILEACQGKSVKEEPPKTYSEVVKEDLTHALLVQSMIGMRRVLCFKCADTLHYEMVRLQVIPNNPSWIPCH